MDLMFSKFIFSGIGERVDISYNHSEKYIFPRIVDKATPNGAGQIHIKSSQQVIHRLCFSIFLLIMVRNSMDINLPPMFDC